MDDANWRPMQGSNPAATAAAAAGVDMSTAAESDWRAKIKPEARSRVVGWILEHLKRLLPAVSRQDTVNLLQRSAVRLEDKAYTAATNQPDYFRKISLKILALEKRTPQAPRNALVNPNRNNPGQDASGVDPNDPAYGDWRAQLQPEARSRVVNKILEEFKRHLPVSVPEGASELQKIAVRFEEKIYTTATSQSDYVRKISLKMLSMETKTQQAPRNAQVIPNQNNPGQGTIYTSAGSTSKTNHSGQNEIYQIQRDQTKKRKGQFEVPQPSPSSRMGSITCRNYNRLGHMYTYCGQPLNPSLQENIAVGAASSGAQAIAPPPAQHISSSAIVDPSRSPTSPPRHIPSSIASLRPTALAQRHTPSVSTATRSPARRGEITYPRITNPAPSSTTPAKEHANATIGRSSRNKRLCSRIKGYLTASNIDDMTVEDMKKV